MSAYIVHKAVEVKNLNKRSALALKLKEDPDYIARVFWKQLKYDGCNCVAIWDGAKLEFFSRTGEVVKSMDHLRPSFEFLKPGMYLGEAWLPGLDFPTLSGIFRRQTVKPDCPLLKLVVFDYLTPSEGKLGQSHLPYRERFNRMFVPTQAMAWVNVAQTVFPGEALGGGMESFSPEELALYLHGQGGFDGLILRDPEGTWAAGDDGRNGEIIKVKPRLRVSCRVTGYLEGRGKHLGRVGTLLVEYKGVEQGAGTGLTNAQRTYAYYHNNWKGKVVEIEALGETPDGRLREPVLLGVRSDVVTPD
jgi:ATP-dependent DNA ligase